MLIADNIKKIADKIPRIADNIKKIADKMPRIADKVSRTADSIIMSREKFQKGTLNIQRIFFYSLLSSILVFQLTLPYLNEQINPDIDEMIDEVVHLFTVSLYNLRERNKSK